MFVIMVSYSLGRGIIVVVDDGVKMLCRPKETGHEMVGNLFVTTFHSYNMTFHSKALNTIVGIIHPCKKIVIPDRDNLFTLATSKKQRYQQDNK